MFHRILFLSLIFLLSGCIQIQPRRPGPSVSTPSPAAEQAPEARIRPASGRQRKDYELILTRIERKTIRWEDISRYPAPEQPWREERFRFLRNGGELQTADFILIGISSGQSGSLRFTFSFRPLRVAYNGRLAWDTQVVFEFNPADELTDIHMFSKLVPMSADTLFRLSGAECNSISGTVLKTLFKLRLPEQVRAAERFRFCFPVNGADRKFRNHLRPSARIPELDPWEEYPDFPLPFERGRYRSFDRGAFYYYAGIVLPVTEKEAWVFDTAVLYSGGRMDGTFYKLKKGLLFWEIVTEGTYDAPSRAVREKDAL